VEFERVRITTIAGIEKAPGAIGLTRTTNSIVSRTTIALARRWVEFSGAYD
jgi:hypothetical protein